MTPTDAMAHTQPPRRMTAAEFGEHFAASSRALWCIAAAALSDRSLAEDVVQEAALIALQKLDELDGPPRSFIAWVGQIVRNLALNHNRLVRRRRTSGTDPVILDQSLPGVGAPEAAPMLTGRGQLLDVTAAFDDRLIAALSELEEIARACLLLRALLDMPYAQIALALDIPEGTAMSHSHRARRAMAKMLAPKSHETAPAAEDRR